MPNFLVSFDSCKLKSQLKMAATRLEIDANKKTALMKQNMREVAELLSESPPKEEVARVKTEALVRDDNMIIAYEILRAECLLLMERVKAIENSTECPPHLVSGVSDVIFAAKQLNIKELTSARKQLRQKFGRTFKNKAMNNEDKVLNEKLVRCLSLEPVTPQTINEYMKKICKQYDIDWSPTAEHVFGDLIVLTPAITGLVNNTTTYNDSNDGAQSSSQDIESIVPMPLPFAPGHKQVSDGTSVTSASSSSNSHHDNDDFDIPPAPPCEGASAPPSGGPLIIATNF